MKEFLANKKVLIMVVAVLLIAGITVGAVIFAGGDNSGDPDKSQPQGGQKAEAIINLNDYVFLSYHGRDGQGEIDCVVLGSDLIQKLHKYTVGLYDDKSLKNTVYGDNNHGIRVFSFVNKEKFDTLSNGDVVHFTWEVNERGLRLLKEQVPGVKFVWEDFDDVVSGLEGVMELDPFSDDNNMVRIDCDTEESKVSGQAILTDWQLYIRCVGSIGTYRGVKIEVDTLGHEGYWKNGDQVKITILDSDEYILEEIGVVLTAKTGYVTVDWLKEPKE